MAPALPPIDVPHLVQQIAAIAGCERVLHTQTSGRDEFLLTWFRDKASLVRWYESEYHRNLQHTFFPDHLPRPPLVDLPDDVGPLFVLVSFQLMERGRLSADPKSLVDITIDVYQSTESGMSMSVAGSRKAD